MEKKNKIVDERIYINNRVELNSFRLLLIHPLSYHNLPFRIVSDKQFFIYFASLILLTLHVIYVNIPLANWFLFILWTFIFYSLFFRSTFNVILSRISKNCIAKNKKGVFSWRNEQSAYMNTKSFFLFYITNEFALQTNHVLDTYLSVVTRKE